MQLTKTSKNTIAGLASLLFPFYTFVVWVYVVQHTAAIQALRMQAFYNYLPAFLRDSFTVTIAALALSIAAFGFFLAGYLSSPKKQKPLLAWAQFAGMLCAGILCLWLLFTLL